MRRTWCLLTVLIAAAACGGGDDSNAGSSSTVVAFATAFENFHSWYNVPAKADSGMMDGVHTEMPLTAYINKVPPKGSTSFPLGTIIVKEVTGGALQDRKIFAMVKRGGGFDSAGAVDWEWFELKNVDEKSVSIVWRGVGPPSGEAYGGNPATCNECHVAAKTNDFVWSTGLSLSTL